MYGYTAAHFVKPGHVVAALNQLTPMQVVGVEVPTANYAMTWRGIRRPRDRELSIAGGELIIYDRVTREVISASRTFQIAKRDMTRDFGAVWITAPTCSENKMRNGGLDFSDYSQRVLRDR
jgi:hypothetical protein